MIIFFLDEINGDQKSMLRSQVYRYTKRAEELKCVLSFKSKIQTESSSSSSSPTPLMKDQRSKLSATSNSSPAASVDEVDCGVPSMSNARNSSLKNLRKKIILM